MSKFSKDFVVNRMSELNRLIEVLTSSNDREKCKEELSSLKLLTTVFPNDYA